MENSREELHHNAEQARRKSATLSQTSYTNEKTACFTISEDGEGRTFTTFNNPLDCVKWEV